MNPAAVDESVDLTADALAGPIGAALKAAGVDTRKCEVYTRTNATDRGINLMVKLWIPTEALP